MSDKFIKSKAAIAWGPNQPLSIEEVDVMLPRKGEVLVKIIASKLVKASPVSKLATMSFLYTPQNVVNVNSVLQVKPTYAQQCARLKVKV